jgi:hypothetical protein
MNDYTKVALSTLRAIHENHVNTDSVRVKMLGQDSGDFYAIVEDWTRGLEHADHYFLFYFYDKLDAPHECRNHKTMIGAMMTYAQRFVLDNCDGADTRCPTISAEHDAMAKTLEEISSLS